ncbi:MAG: hypothetical protein HYZ50_12525 [Deltaproteobacteria bacterium]|nr:hypothetical protein [Deltaproteobacteria bacterium]
MPPRAPLSAWQVESLRVTVFPTSPLEEGTGKEWWTKLTGELSEEKLSRPKQGIRQEEGPFEGGRLTFTDQSVRIDWQLRFMDVSPAEGKLSLGVFLDGLDSFSKLMSTWLTFETLPPIGRLAFGAIVLLPVSDHDAAYRQLSAYLADFHVPEGDVSDFLYQINRPRKSLSNISAMKINRLSKWSAIRLRLEAGITGAESPPMHLQEKYFCRLELDINTAPDRQEEIPKKQLPQVFEELVRLGKEIVEEGDKP